MTANNCDHCHGSGVWRYGDGQSTEVCPVCRDYRAMVKTLATEVAAGEPTIADLQQMVAVLRAEISDLKVSARRDESNAAALSLQLTDALDTNDTLRESEAKAWGLVTGLMDTITASGDTPVFRRSVVVHDARAALAARKAGA